MARYLEFSTASDDKILIEVEPEEVAPVQGVLKAGLREKAQDVMTTTVTTAQTMLEKALASVIQHNAQALLQGVHGLAEPPEQAELTFGLKATGEVGNIAMAKVSGEGTYTVKLTWKPNTKAKQSQSQAG